MDGMSWGAYDFSSFVRLNAFPIYIPFHFCFAGHARVHQRQLAATAKHIQTHVHCSGTDFYQAIVHCNSGSFSFRRDFYLFVTHLPFSVFVYHDVQFARHLWGACQWVSRIYVDFFCLSNEYKQKNNTTKCVIQHQRSNSANIVH